VAHNVHKIIGWIQQGGSRLLLFGHLTEQLDHNASGKGDTELVFFCNDTSRGWSPDEGGMWLQSMWQCKIQQWDIVPTTQATLGDTSEGPNLPKKAIP
jgi:hypothetical protein